MTATAASSFYRRALPADLVEFASPEGRALFREALADGTMEGYFALAEQFHTQSEPAFCGLGTLVIVLNALAIDPGRAWRGPWRWFGEELLDCCRPLDVVKEKGITFAQLVCLARCNGAQVEARRASESTVEQFRDAVRRASMTSGEPHLVVSYTRAALGQTGQGHFSPIGGFHAARDLVLVLDVARFKYPPHWVPVQKLWEAMLPLDPATGKSRGFIELARADDLQASDTAQTTLRDTPEIRAHCAALVAYCEDDFSTT
jgi:glutathione gamma-glutamylcysteinyltransferase